MNSTFQFQNQTILQHGQSVHEHFKKILEALESKNYETYTFPKNLVDRWPQIKKKLYHIDVLQQYHIYHDCGKPYCCTIDWLGKRHFPNHSQVSYETYSKVFSDDIVAKLIKHDMIFHSGSMEQIDSFINQNDKRFLFSLWMTSLAEIYSNSAMFAADNQDSFKKKYAKLESILLRL